MTASVAESYRHCQQVARRSARNFYYAFLLLPRARRKAMCALYAFLRRTDDLVDDDPVEGSMPLHDTASRNGAAGAPTHRRAALAAWREELSQALAGKPSGSLWPAVSDTVTRYAIPHEYLFEAIDGVEMDLEPRDYETFDDLQQYCYKVASVVGLACLRIWGCDSPDVTLPACRLGIAFQLTNILRDLKEDAQRGRVYLPADDMRRFGYTRRDLLRGVVDERFRSLMQFEIARAEELYRSGLVVEHWLARDSQAAFRALVGIYRGLLDEIARRDGAVFGDRIRLSGWRKASIAFRALWPQTRWPAPSTQTVKVDAR